MPDRNKTNIDEIMCVREEISDDRLAGSIMSRMVIFGGPQVGFNTNPETNERQCFIEVDGEKIVCLAQGGECRYNSNYYTPGLSDAKSWRTPIIDKNCPDRCCYKVLVCDNHPEKCPDSITYYPEYNKFRGQFRRYCRNFDKYLKSNKQENGTKISKKETKKLKKKGITWPHY